MKLTKLTKIALLALAGLALVTTDAKAVVTFNQGDLILGFRQTGNAEVVLVNIGAATTYSAATSNISIPTFANLDTDLKAVFGNNWATDGSIYWGIASARPSVGSTSGTDVNKTIYLSKAEPTLGTQAADFTLSNTTRGTLATRITGVASQFTTTSSPGPYTPFADSGGYAFRQSTSDFTGSNWNDFAPTGFGSGQNIEGNDAAGIDNTALDLFRVSGSGTGINTATYEGTFTLSSTGVLSYSNTVPAVAPEPSRALLLGAALGAMVLRRRRVA
jgi:hypothetical protein